MTYRIGGQVVDQGSGVADQPVFVVDTADADPSNWTVEGATTTNGDGSWSVVVNSGDIERYHAVTQFEDSGTLKNAESKPFVTGQPVVQPVEIPIQFNIPAPQTIGTTIPDSVVVRNDDDDTNSQPDKFGVRFTTEVEWPKIGGRLSANADNETRAYIYRVSDGQLLGDADISSLVSGDAFTINLNSSLQPFDGTDSTRYSFVTDAEGSNRIYGFSRNVTFPVTSNDGNLSMVNGALGEDGVLSSPHNLVEIGDVGF